MSTEAECIAIVYETLFQLAQDETTHKLYEHKLKAMLRLLNTCRYYSSEGFLPELVTTICTKKSRYIAEAKSKTAIDEILKPASIRFNGCEVVSASEYSVPEEELIIWSITSLQAPLNTRGQRRYMKLFRQLLPEIAASLFGEKEGDHFEHQ